MKSYLRRLYLRVKTTHVPLAVQQLRTRCVLGPAIVGVAGPGSQGLPHTLRCRFDFGSPKARQVPWCSRAFRLYRMEQLPPPLASWGNTSRSIFTPWHWLRDSTQPLVGSQYFYEQQVQ